MNNQGAMLSSEVQTWRTPNLVLDYVRKMGPIALDPCGGPGSLVNAAQEYSLEAGQDGLTLPWAHRDLGVVFCNPPYSREVGKWMLKAQQWGMWGDGEVVSLVAARPDTRWFQDYCLPRNSAAVCFWKGRLTFEGAPAPAPFPSALIYHGLRRYWFAEVFSPVGRVWVTT